MESKYNKNFCQHCGGQRVYVETIIDDEFIISESGSVDTNGYTDIFEHTGNNRCAECNKEWSGVKIN
jgi:hypothetical protein